MNTSNHIYLPEISILKIVSLLFDLRNCVYFLCMTCENVFCFWRTTHATPYIEQWRFKGEGTYQCDILLAICYLVTEWKHFPKNRGCIMHSQKLPFLVRCFKFTPLNMVRIAMVSIARVSITRMSVASMSIDKDYQHDYFERSGYVISKCIWSLRICVPRSCQEH